jgi:hypothetical protein
MQDQVPLVNEPVTEPQEQQKSAAAVKLDTVPTVEQADVESAMPAAAVQGGPEMTLESDEAQGDEITRLLITSETLSMTKESDIGTPHEQIDEDQLDKVRAANAASAIASGGDGLDSVSLEEGKSDNGDLNIALAALPDLVGPDFRPTPPATQRGRGPYILLNVLPKVIKGSYRKVRCDSGASTSKLQTTRKRNMVRSYRPASRGSSRSSDDAQVDGSGDAAYKVDSLLGDEQDEDEDDIYSDGEVVLRSRVPMSGIARSRNRRPGANVKYATDQLFESESSSEPLGGSRGRAIAVRVRSNECLC